MEHSCSASEEIKRRSTDLNVLAISCSSRFKSRGISSSLGLLLATAAAAAAAVSGDNDDDDD